MTDRRRHHSRHGRLHGPGAGEGAAGGQAQRRLGVRVRAVRDAHRAARVRGRRCDRHAGVGPDEEPDWSALPPELPPAIRTLLKRCLERERRKRIGDIAAVRFVLDDAANLSIVAPPKAPVSTRERATRTAWTIAAVIAAIAVVATAAYRYRPTPTAKAFMFSILPPEGTMFASASQGGTPALSPDGTRIAFVADGPAGRLLWLQSIDAFDARPSPRKPKARWARSGRQMARGLDSLPARA